MMCGIIEGLEVYVICLVCLYCFKLIVNLNYLFDFINIVLECDLGGVL